METEFELKYDQPFTVKSVQMILGEENDFDRVYIEGSA